LTFLVIFVIIDRWEFVLVSLSEKMINKELILKSSNLQATLIQKMRK